MNLEKYNYGYGRRMIAEVSHCLNYPVRKKEAVGLGIKLPLCILTATARDLLVFINNPPT